MPTYSCFLQLEEDLENYHQWKLAKFRPRLKPTASLHYSMKQLEKATSTPDQNIVQVYKTFI